MQLDQLKRRDFITLLGGAAAWPLTAGAQQVDRMRRIGVLIAGLTENDSEGQLRMAAFRRGLQNLGWVEGRNVHIEERWPGGNNERLPWSLDPKIDELRVIELQPGVVQLYVPITFMISPAGQTAQPTRFLMNQVVVKTADGWKVSSILPIPAPQP
jgi:hypothetical protein